MEEERFENLVQSWKERYERGSLSGPSMSDERENLSKGAEGHYQKVEATLPLAGSVATATVARSASVEDSNADQSNGDQSESDTLVHQRQESNKDDDDKEQSEAFDNEDDSNKSSGKGGEKKTDKEDNMDGVYVKKSVSDKPRPNADTEHEEDNCDKCMLDCIYFTMQCCTCSIM